MTVSNVIDRQFPQWAKNEDHIRSGGGGGGDMESRVAKLESDVSDIKTTLTDIKADMKTVQSDIGTLKTDVAVIKSNYAKKEDVASSANKIILWVAGVVVFSQLVPAMPKIIEAIGKLAS